MTTQEFLYRSIVTGRIWPLGLPEMMEMGQVQGMCVSTLGMAVLGIKSEMILMGRLLVTAQEVLYRSIVTGRMWP